jgi:hypothetical protein
MLPFSAAMLWLALTTSSVDIRPRRLHGDETSTGQSARRQTSDDSVGWRDASVRTKAPRKSKLGAAHPLAAAAARGNTAELATLLDGGAGAEMICQPVEFGMTALHLAAARDHSGAVDMLLRHGAPVHVTNDRGWTPLHLAASRGAALAAAKLLAAGADAAAKGGAEQRAIEMAAHEGHHALAQSLRQQAADTQGGSADDIEVADPAPPSVKSQAASVDAGYGARNGKFPPSSMPATGTSKQFLTRGAYGMRMQQSSWVDATRPGPPPLQGRLLPAVAPSTMHSVHIHEVRFELLALLGHHFC